jgi:dihydrofolate reductase
MARTIYFVASSMDGFIADEAGKLDWLTQFDGAEGVRELYETFLAGIGVLAMGAETYRFLVAHGGPWPYADRPTFVFTRRTFSVPPGADVRFVSGDVASVLPDLERAAGDRDVWLVGGGELAAQFAAAHAIDEIHLGVAPLSLGHGTPVLPVAVGPMTLVRVTQLGRGFVELRYAIATS